MYVHLFPIKHLFPSSCSQLALLFPPPRRHVVFPPYVATAFSLAAVTLLPPSLLLCVVEHTVPVPNIRLSLPSLLSPVIRVACCQRDSDSFGSPLLTVLKVLKLFRVFHGTVRHKTSVIFVHLYLRSDRQLA